MVQRRDLSELKKKVEAAVDAEEIYLFGSMARGDYHSESDYDIAVVSKDFEDLNTMERHEKVIDKIREFTKDQPVDVVCYTPVEFEKGSKSFLPALIQEEGISIKS